MTVGIRTRRTFVQPPPPVVDGCSRLLTSIDPASEPELFDLLQRIQALVKKEEINNWLNSPVDYLGGLSPMELIRADQLGVLRHYVDVSEGSLM